MVTCHGQDAWFAVLAAVSYGAAALQRVAAGNPLAQPPWRYFLWSFVPFSLFAVQASDCTVFILSPAFLFVMVLTSDVWGVREKVAQAVQGVWLIQLVSASRVVRVGAGVGLFITIFYFVYRGWLVKRGILPS